MIAAAVALIAAAAASPPAPVGDAIYHYVRSNLDGSKPEHVVHFRPTRTGIAVYKWVEKCTTAAYVTAEMDGDLHEGRRFVAGKVAKDGSQAAFGTLILDEKKPALVMDVTPPGGERIEETYALKSRPYLLYDFDLADLNSILQDKEPPKSFSFELPLIWPSETTMFRDQGQMRATFAGKEQHLGRDTLRYDLEVDEPTPATGHLWIDAKQRFIVEAELGLPNHLDYQDFRLKLERIDSGGQRSWDALTRTQYANCPTGN